VPHYTVSTYTMRMLRQSSTAIWGLLMLATIASWWLGTDHGFIGGPQIATAAVLVIAFVKVAMVTSNFMEVASAPRALQVAVHGWTVIVCTALVALFLTL